MSRTGEAVAVKVLQVSCARNRMKQAGLVHGAATSTARHSRLAHVPASVGSQFCGVPCAQPNPTDTASPASLHVQFPASEHRQAKRVIRECRIAASTSHPNCVATHSHFTISVRRQLTHTRESRWAAAAAVAA